MILKIRVKFTHLLTQNVNMATAIAVVTGSQQDI